MGFVLLTLVIVIALWVISENKVIIRNNLEALFSALCVVAIAVFVISGAALGVQVKIRNGEFVKYQERQNKVISFAKTAKTITYDQQQKLLDDISSVNEYIHTTRKNMNGFFFGMYYNPLIVDLPILSYELIANIPLHQNVIVKSEVR